MSRSILTTLLLAIIATTGCSPNNQDGVISYKVKDEIIYLNKNCVTRANLKETYFSKNSPASISIVFDIKDDSYCSKKINDFFKKNINNEVIATFNEEDVLAKSKIVSEVKVERGFSQYVPNKNLAEKIILSYKK